MCSMWLYPLLYYLVAAQSNHSTLSIDNVNQTIVADFNRSRLNDEVFGTATNRVFLKNKLLDNLNNFFPGGGMDELEILDGAAEVRHNDIDPPTEAPPTLAPVERPTYRATPIDDPTVAPSRRHAEMEENDVIHTFPPEMTDVPFTISFQPDIGGDVATPTPVTPSPEPPSTTQAIRLFARDSPNALKRRSEGSFLNNKTAEGIRDWRRRLYQAFKNKGGRARQAERVEKKEEPAVFQLPNITPLIVDKNRQIIMNREHRAVQPASPTFGKDPGGRVIRMFGVEASGYRSEDGGAPPAYQPQGMQGLPASFMAGMSPVPAPPLPVSRRPMVVYVPAPSTPRTPVYSPFQQYPVRQYSVTATAAPIPPTTPMQLLREFEFEYAKPALPSLPGMAAFPAFPAPPAPPLFATLAPPPAAPPRAYPPMAETRPAASYPVGNKAPSAPAATAYRRVNSVEEEEEEDPDDAMLEEEERGFSEDGQSESQNNDCVEGVCGGGTMQQPAISDEKCNSMRLRTLIQNHIVAADAEMSKRVIQQAAERETGRFFDVICGTGFFSYIAHTDEFCQASALGVNCYVFSPVCNESMFRKRRKVFLNRN